MAFKYSEITRNAWNQKDFVSATLPTFILFKMPTEKMLLMAGSAAITIQWIQLFKQQLKHCHSMSMYPGIYRQNYQNFTLPL